MKICPTCKKKRRKVIQVNEWKGSWDARAGLYTANIVGSDRNPRMYEKCRVCRTIL